MTQHILYIESSIFGADGVSSQLAQDLIEKLRAQNPGSSLTERHLNSDNIPHFDAATIGAVTSGEAELANTLIEEVQAADILVIGAPMYNFGVPTQLKAWFDHIARAGTTFQYTETGPVGLLKNKQAYVVTSRGGFHRDGQTDVLTPFMKIILGFLGISDVTFVYAEGLNMGDDLRNKSMAEAQAQIADMTLH